MDLKSAFKGQYHAGFAQIRQCIERCPDDLWSAQAGVAPRTFWRIAYHAIFYTHLYLMNKHEDFQPWEKNEWHASVLWDDDERGVPPQETTYTRDEVLSYLDLVDAGVDGWMDAMDLEAAHSGIPWYNISKIDHQVVNIRHMGIHIGQLQELLYARGIDVDWISRRP